MNRIILQPAYLLHRRPYRETSFLIDFFTLEYGRLTAIAKGVRKASSPLSGLLQPFTPLQISLAGKGELMALSQVETTSAQPMLQGDCLYAGFYLNELLISLLHKGDPHPGLYRMYADTITALQVATLEPKLLRSFEKYLLEALGYGVLHSTFLPNANYRLIHEQGLVLSELTDDSESQSNVFSGKSLNAMVNDDWQEESTMQAAKRLMRLVLAPLLGARPVFSRQLFMTASFLNDHS